MLEMENLQNIDGEACWAICCYSLPSILTYDRKSELLAWNLLMAVTLQPFKAEYVVANSSVINQHYLPNTCAIKTL